MPFELRDYQITDIKRIRVALTRFQRILYVLATALRKAADRRSFDGDTVQVEAIPSDVLARIVTTAVTDRLDHTSYAATLLREARIRAELAATLERLLDATDNDHHGDDA